MPKKTRRSPRTLPVHLRPSEIADLLQVLGEAMQDAIEGDNKDELRALSRIARTLDAAREQAK